MLLPFDEETWLYLNILLAFTFITIFIVNQMPQFVQDEFYGKGVNTPAVNSLMAIFGIGQSKLPQNNFARILFINFVVFCFIMRTAYQGMIKIKKIKSQD
jgi:hypothetical protein